jgi:acetamidase/formamidase
MRDAGIGAAQVGRDAGVAHREAADVRLIDHGVAPPALWVDISGPVEVSGHHGGDALVVDGSGIRIQEQRIGVVVMAGPRVAGAVGSQRIALSSAHPGDGAEPPTVGSFSQRDLSTGCSVIGTIDQEQAHRVGVPGIHRELRAVVGESHPGGRR